MIYSAIIKELIAAGISGDALVAAVERIESAQPIARPAIDAQAERRRATDRERASSRRRECHPVRWRELRQQTFRRDGFKCVYCGSSNSLQADHVVPLARGGASTLTNLTTACKTCNTKKGARLWG